MIQIFNRVTGKYEVENVAGESYLKWCYSSPIGMNFLELFIKKKAFSKLYGKYCDTSLSRSKINKFVSDLNIDMDSCIKDIKDFQSFNDFFIRELSPCARPIPKDNNVLMSPGDGRLTVLDNIDINNLVQVKNLTYSLIELIGDESIAKKYDNGICMILRLCPTDYHRFHFIDDGICSPTHKINGHYYSVSPIALEKIPKLFCENKREWSILHSENFGDVLCIEVGATCVGSIIQTYTPNLEVRRGEEKGYFKFGGSTTILFFEKNKIKVDDDILNQSSLGFETKVLLGEKIGLKL